MFSKFNEESRKVLIDSKKEMVELKHPYIGSEHLILSILKNSGYKVTKILNKNGINYDNFKRELLKVIGVGKDKNNWYIYTPLLIRLIVESIFFC